MSHEHTSPEDRSIDSLLAWDAQIDRRTAFKRLTAMGAGTVTAAALAYGGSASAAQAALMNGANSITRAGKVTSATCALASECRTLDPDGPDGQYYVSLTVVNACYDTLVGFSIPANFKTALKQAKTGSFATPVLASSWETAKGGKIVRFNLRKGVKSSAGNELTAESFVLMVNKTLAAKAVGLFLFSVVGVTSASQVKAVDSHTLQFTLPGPEPLLLQCLGCPWMVGYDTEVIKANATASDPYASKYLDTHTAGFGPYEITEFAPGGTTVKLQLRSDYWGRKSISHITQVAVPDASTREQLLLSGQLQFGEQLTQTELNALPAGGAIADYYTDCDGAYLILTQQAPFNDPAIRAGIAKAIPYAAIKSLVYGNAKLIVAPWKSMFAPIVPGYTTAYGYDTDTSAAQAALAGIKGTALQIAYSVAQPVAEQIAIQVQAALNNVGLNVSLNAMQDPTFVQGVGAKTVPTFLSNLQPVPLFVSALYHMQAFFATPAFNNYNHYSNPKIDAIVKELGANPPLAKANALTKQAQQILMHDLPSIPIVWSGSATGTRGVKLARSHTGNGLVWWQDLVPA